MKQNKSEVRLTILKSKRQCFQTLQIQKPYLFIFLLELRKALLPELQPGIRPIHKIHLILLRLDLLLTAAVCFHGQNGRVLVIPDLVGQVESLLATGEFRPLVRRHLPRHAPLHVHGVQLRRRCARGVLAQERHRAHALHVLAGRTQIEDTYRNIM